MLCSLTKADTVIISQVPATNGWINVRKMKCRGVYLIPMKSIPSSVQAQEKSSPSATVIKPQHYFWRSLPKSSKAYILSSYFWVSRTRDEETRIQSLDRSEGYPVFSYHALKTEFCHVVIQSPRKAFSTLYLHVSEVLLVDLELW